MEDCIAIEDMVSESYVAIVKQLHSKNSVCVCVCVCALRCFSSWFRSHGLTADAYLSLPKVAPESARLNRIKPGAPEPWLPRPRHLRQRCDRQAHWILQRIPTASIRTLQKIDNKMLPTDENLSSLAKPYHQ